MALTRLREGGQTVEDKRRDMRRRRRFLRRILANRVMSHKHKKNLSIDPTLRSTDGTLQLPNPLPVAVQPPAAPIQVAVQLPTQPVPIALQPSAAPEKPGWLFWVNVSVFVVFGTLLSWWLYYYTDWLEAFTGLLSLTGIFAWLALATKIIPEDRLKYFQSKVWAKIVEHYAFGVLFGVLLGIGVLTSFCFGTIEVASTLPDQAFWIYRPADKPNLSAPERVSASGHFRAVLRAGQNYTVRVPGYPEKTIPVRAWRRVEQYVPFSFLRPVVLIWPEKSVVLQIKPGEARLIVEIEGKAEEPITFYGKPVWVGCEELIVPRHLSDDWLKELTDEKLDASTINKVQTAWSQTQVLIRTASELREGMKIKGSLIRNMDNPDHVYARTIEYTVRPVQPGATAEQQDMVQPLPLRVVK